MKFLFYEIMKSGNEQVKIVNLWNRNYKLINWNSLILEMQIKIQRAFKYETVNIIVTLHNLWKQYFSCNGKSDLLQQFVRHNYNFLQMRQLHCRLKRLQKLQLKRRQSSQQRNRRMRNQQNRKQMNNHRKLHLMKEKTKKTNLKKRQKRNQLRRKKTKRRRR